MQSYNVTDTCSIYQLVRTGNSEAYNVSPAYTNVNASITPAGENIVMAYGGVDAFQLFEIFIWDITVSLHNGDKIVTQDGTQYILSGQPFSVSNKYLQYQKLVGKKVV